jgi:hypothetical protein
MLKSIRFRGPDLFALLANFDAQQLPVQPCAQINYLRSESYAMRIPEAYLLRHARHPTVIVAMRARSVTDEIAALALVPSWAGRNMRQVVERALAQAGVPRVSRAPFPTCTGACGSTRNGPLTRVAHRRGADMYMVARPAPHKLPTAAATSASAGIWANVGNEWPMQHPETAANAERPGWAVASIGRERTGQVGP